MTDAGAPRSLNCPNCGAPLNFPEGQASVRCRFCDSTIERSLADLTDDDDAHVIQIDTSGFHSPGTTAGPARRFVLKMRNGQPVVIEIGKQPAAAPTNEQMFSASHNANAAAAAAARPRRTIAPPARRSSLGCVVAVVGLLAIACLVAAIAFNASPHAGLMARQLLAGKFDQALATSRTLGSNIILTQSGLLIPGPNDGPDQALMLSLQYAASGNARDYRLIAVDTATRKLLWQSAPLDPELYDTRILVANDLVFLLSGRQLVALRRADGATVWTAPLADVISLNVCQDCLQLAGDRLAALSDDGTLEVFDAATGQSQWAVRSYQDSPRGLYVLGGRLAFMDRDASVHGILRTFDPATGKEQSAQPICQAPESGEEYADWTTHLMPSPDGSAFYLAFGYLPQCFQRWDARTLTLVWSSALPVDFSTSIDGVVPVLTADTLFLAYGPQVLAVSAAQGEARSVVQDESYEFAIEAAHGGDLILRAQRSRGSTRYELWVVDAATGQTRWTFDLGDNPPMDPGSIIDDNTPEWLAQAADSGLRLLRFKSAADNRSHAILNETLDWQTGQTGGQTETRLGLSTIIFSAPDWTVWKGDTLWMISENKLLAFDSANNKVISRWP
jgi:LSD1 subclass zinc finger protein